MSSPRKTVLITGCSAGGVGAALAVAFKDKGYHVFATARTPSKVPDTLHSASNVAVFALDVTSADSIREAAELVAKKSGKLDVLINNAGLGLNMPALDTPLEEAKKQFDLNFFGAFAMLQAFGALLVKAKGCVVNNSSVGGVLPFPFSSTFPPQCRHRARLILRPRHVQCK
jgi:1-acylglycerone phosphate reductase